MVGEPSDREEIRMIESPMRPSMAHIHIQPWGVTPERRDSVQPQAILRDSRRARILKSAAAGVCLLAAAAAVLLVVFLVNKPSASGKLSVPQQFKASFRVVNKFNSSIEYSGQFFKTTAADASWDVTMVTTRRLSTKLRQVWTVKSKWVYVQTFDDSISTTKPQAAACVNPGTLPPLQDLAGLFAAASPLPAEATYNLAAGCATTAAEHRYALQWGAVDQLGVRTFVVCAEPGATSASVEGSEFSAQVFNLETTNAQLLVDVPVGNNGLPMDCPAVNVPSILQSTPSTASRLLSEATDGHWLLPVRRDSRRLAATIYCVFVSPVWSSAAEYFGTTIPAFWSGLSAAGRVGAKCTYKYYANVNMANGWDASSITTQCASYLNSLTSPVYVFAHGGAAVAILSARYNNQCTFPSGSRFYHIGAPVGGTAFEPSAASLCPSSASPTYASALTGLGACTGTAESTYMKSFSTTYTPTTSTWAELITYAAKAGTITGTMCGISTSGLASPTNTALQSVADVAAMGGVTRDGWVALTTCAASRTTSATSYTATDYTPAVTTFDLACQNGNALVDPSTTQQPCSFITSKTT